MPRRRTVFLKQNIYHLFSRGNRKQVIFTESRDYQRFLEKVEKYRLKYSVEALAYCLLPNHFHLLLRQLGEPAISKFMSSLLSSHSHYFSLKHKLPPGHFFQGRFGSRLIESGEDLLNVSRYIHLNPIKENILLMDFTLNKSRSFRNSQMRADLRNYPWSSYKQYLNQDETSELIINRKYILNLEKKHNSYRRFVESKITDEDAINLEGF